MSKLYKLFISHSWAYDKHYRDLSVLLDNQGLVYYDHSVPKDDPIHNASNDYQLYDAIKRQMAGANCVLILAGVYASYSKWINKEIEIAKTFGKPIIAVEYWGAERTSSKVKINADRIVKWQGSSIVKAIWDLA